MQSNLFDSTVSAPMYNYNQLLKIRSSFSPHAPYLHSNTPCEIEPYKTHSARVEIDIVLFFFFVQMPNSFLWIIFLPKYFIWKLSELTESAGLGVHIHMYFVLIKKYQFAAVFVAAG